MVNPYGDQLDVSVLAASPVELTRMLFDKLMSEIGKARQFLRGGDVRMRCLSASRAIEIVGELARSLDDERGGELSRNLRLIYVYIVEQVNEGNTRQQERWFANAEAVASPLAEAWREIADRGSGPGLASETPACLSDGFLAGGLSLSG